MISKSEWQSFVQRARGEGSRIEILIRAFYCDHLLVSTDNAIDGGSHSGYHTIPLAKQLTEGKVVAVDANAAMVGRLRAKVESIPNIILEHAALQADPDAESITFNVSTSHLGRSGISRIWDQIAPGTVEYAPPTPVPATTIDKLIRKHALGTLRFIKLDLEGGEFNAIRGAIETMSTLRPVFVTEHSVKAPEVNGFSVSEYFQYMASLNYVVLAPNGMQVTASNPFPFWYVFLVPVEMQSDVAHGLEQAFLQTVAADP
jgi:FkbM family methyltransferase